MSTSRPEQTRSCHGVRRRPFAGRLALAAICAGLLVAEAAPDSPADDANAADADQGSELRDWLSELPAAYREAQARRRPILVRFGGESCPWCRKLADEIGSEKIQSELARWSLVYLDVEKSPDEARRLGVGPIPALRVLSATGRLVDSHDGFLPADELLPWLDEAFAAASDSADDALLGDHEPTMVEVVKIVRAFANRDAVVREAALRRLTPFPTSAAGVVVKTVRDGNLSAKLAALELLNAWHAPVQELDPWQPETMTAERLAALDRWLTELDPARFPAPPAELTPTERQSLAADVERMLRAEVAHWPGIVEQIARRGTPALELVVSRLKDAATDEDRRRLLTLRYRLVAGNSLALRWPGGVERLADPDPAVRHRAAEELAGMANVELQPLLLELFSDPDTFVRELSLLGLKNIEGEDASSVLVGLLKDPEPNVRAAVLKQLTEDARPGLVRQIAEYVRQERDPDLIVHAVRFFRETTADSAVDSLLELLKHESWRVRAESAEALGKKLGKSSRGGGSNPESEPIQDALLNLLTDSDSFVVSRALDGLEYIDAVRAVDPLLATAENRPALATQVVDILARGGSMSAKALPRLREFTTHERPEVRAAAVRGLCRLDQENIEQPLIAALSDSHSLVRTAGAAALLEMLNGTRPNESSGFGMSAYPPSAAMPRRSTPPPVSTSPSQEGFFSRIARSIFGGEASEVAPVEDSVFSEASDDEEAMAADEAPSLPDDEDLEEPDDSAASIPDDDDEFAEVPSDEDFDAPVVSDDSIPEDDETAAPDVDLAAAIEKWLAGLYAGEGRAPWTERAVPLLEKQLAADQPEERVAAALALTPLGRSEAALPVLVDAVKTNPNLLHGAAQVLAWLTWEPRLKVFDQLESGARGDEERAQLVEALVNIPDRRAAARIWQLLERPEATIGLAQAVEHGVQTAYFGTRYFVYSSASRSLRKRIVAEVRPQASSGPALRRLTAINLLLPIAAEDALTAAAEIMNDPAAEESLRQDAFQIILAANAGPERDELAVQALAGEDDRRRSVALRYLALGPDSLFVLTATQFHLHDDVSDNQMGYSQGESSTPELPRKLTADLVRPLIHHANAENAAYAGYLLALMGEPEGMTPLLQYWRTREIPDSDSDKLVYRAIAALNSTDHIPLLNQIYRRLPSSTDEQRDFYWTIRSMSGPEVLRLRKQIRDEVGMSNLQ